jgi:DNA mismatch repair protein MutL
MEMDKIDFKANCPHGRPVMQRLSLVEIERMFRRQ